MIDIDALRQVPLFAELSDEQLQWLAEQGTEVWLQPGEILRAQGDPAEHIFVMIEGSVVVTEKVGEQDLVLATYGPKTLFGELPILMGMTEFWATGRSLSNCHILELGKDTFWQMLAKIPAVATAILRTMAERVQDLQSMSQQREKLIELGTLAAGLAHELNNPAAAVGQGALDLEEIFEKLPSLALKLDQQMTGEQRLFLANLLSQAIRAITSSQLDPLTQSDREDEVIAWLKTHNVADGRIAHTLVQAGLDTQSLATVREHTPTDSLGDVLVWLEASLKGIGLLSEIEQSSARISELVKAIKEYSYMDQAPLQEVDVHEGLENTLIMLKRKLKEGVVVTREYDRSLPRIRAYGSELNQVWTNLIDNAIDAIGGQGKIWIRTKREHDQVLVEIADNGTGIPPEIQGRIFEPFFTTKGVGEGTGLGLVTSYRTIMGKHQGDIQVSSQPGDTCFQIRLPINQIK